MSHTQEEIKMPASSLYSAKVNAAEGFSAPVALADLPGWTVFKMEQTEVYVITHNLDLTNPEREMQVVATSMNPEARVVVNNMRKNSFTVSAWTQDLSPIQTDFMFIATCLHRASRPSI
jgi:hypothetical protein